MAHLFWSRKLFLLLFSIALLGQVQKKDLARLPYDELKKLYFDNEKNQTKQFEYANAYLVKADNDNISIRKAKGYYYFALLFYVKDENKAIKYLDSVIKYSLNTNDIYFPAAAYCEKAELLKKQYKFREAMVNYNLAEKIALKTNIDFYYNVRNYIGITKSEDLGEYNEALVIFKECYRYYKSKDVNDPKYSSNYHNIIFGIADSFKSLNISDSTTYYNKLGYQESAKNKNEEYKYLFVLNEGANQILKQNYKAAIDSINKALPQLIAFKNEGNTLAAYYYLGKAHDGLGNKEQAVINFIKVDSIYKETKNYSKEFISGYNYLINYYKNKKDKENQLKYIIEYMAIANTLQKNYKELNKLVQNEYDTPHLMSEKESLIKSLHDENTKSYWSIVGLTILTISVSGFGIYQHNLKKKYKSRFDKIMIRDKATNPHEIAEQNNNKKKDLGVSEELVNQILEKLSHFETNNEFLESNITIQILAEKMETNSKYVSKIVNFYKEKTFIRYINDLRIDYATDVLQQNKKLRNYTIQALALEFGFNSAESFSTAFYKKSGIKPTYFIKELG